MSGKRLLWTGLFAAAVSLVVISDAEARCCCRVRTRCCGFRAGCNTGCGNYGYNNGCSTGGCNTGGCSAGGCSAGGCSAGGYTTGYYNNGYNNGMAPVDNSGAPIQANAPMPINQPVQVNGQIQQNTNYSVGKPVITQPNNLPPNNPSPDVDNSVRNLTTTPIQGANPAKAPQPAAAAAPAPQP
jgi:hypothetical protein